MAPSKKPPTQRPRRRIVRHKTFTGFLVYVERLAREEFVNTRPHNEPVPQFREFRTAAGRAALKEIFDRLPTEFRNHEETQAILADRLKGSLPDEDNNGIIARAIDSFIMLHCEDVKEGNNGATHHREAEIGEADRGTERRKPADTFKVVLNNYTHIEYNGKSVHLNSSAAQILKYMSEDCREQDVEPTKARDALGMDTESWRDLFRRTGLWDTLIIKGKGSRTRRLSVYP